jgi:hypothetical protein
MMQGRQIKGRKAKGGKAGRQEEEYEGRKNTKEGRNDNGETEIKGR